MSLSEIHFQIKRCPSDVVIFEAPLLCRHIGIISISTSGFRGGKHLGNICARLFSENEMPFSAQFPMPYIPTQASGKVLWVFKLDQISPMNLKTHSPCFVYMGKSKCDKKNVKPPWNDTRLKMVVILVSLA